MDFVDMDFIDNDNKTIFRRVCYCAGILRTAVNR